MRYVIDIDGTICTDTNGDYENAEPLIYNISVVNHLYEAGHHITYFTARGMGRTRIKKPPHAMYDLMQLTAKQLEEWECKYHSLQMGKPSGDIYIDDKGINANEFFRVAP